MAPDIWCLVFVLNIVGTEEVQLVAGSLLKISENRVILEVCSVSEASIDPVTIVHKFTHSKVNPLFPIFT